MDLLSAKQVSDIIGVPPVGTLRYWRHCDIGPASFTLGRRVVYRRERYCDGSRNKKPRPGGGEAETPREPRPRKRPRGGLAEVFVRTT